MTNFWECNFCKNLFTAGNLYPCNIPDVHGLPRRYLLCSDCLAESEDLQLTTYIDELEETIDQQVERLR